ncbi:MAG: ClpXP protease specificity-enhancing factor [Zoogloeaceae bacterium]|jgi:stringent starvation protein B|nr:ClpXP protease specificity-enhancing factor [Zoogloeaceae bacterium]
MPLPADLPSTKPYLLRALWEWCSDHGFTPYMTVAIDDQCNVPREFARDGEIVLNVSVEATHNLNMDNEGVSFQARFGGVVRNVYVPMRRITSFYARENGAGMRFPVEEPEEGREETTPSPDGAPPSPPSPGSPPFLRRVK